MKRLGLIMSLAILASATACTEDIEGAKGQGQEQEQEKNSCETAGCNDGRVCENSKCVLHVALNGDCSASDSICDEGTCKSGVCKEPNPNAKVGDPCTDNDDCGSMYCVNKACATNKLETGAKCDNNNDCTSNACDDNRCVEYKTLDQSCDSNNICSEPYICNESSNTCTERPGLGEACDNSLGCLADLSCVNHQCVVENLTNGANCDDLHLCNDDWFCSLDGQCAKSTSIGGECSEFVWCPTSAACFNGKCLQTLGKCTSDNDCNTDSYCCTEDECDTKDVCVRYGEGPRSNVNEACTYQTIPGLFEAAIQCEWKAPAAGDAFPNHANVLMTPLVINTPHDSGLANEIIFTTYNSNDGSAQSGAGTDFSLYGVIRIINAETCELQENIFDDDNHVIGGSNLAAADVDKDGYVEIFASRGSAQKSGIPGGGIVAFHWVEPDANAEPGSKEAKGYYTTWWRTDKMTTGSYSSTIGWGGASIHDINDDDIPEIIGFGGEVFNTLTGQRINVNQAAITPDLGGSPGVVPTVADLDGDGKVEIIGTRSVYRWNNETNKWDTAYSDVVSSNAAHMAFADFGTPTEDGFDLEHLDGISEVADCGGGVVEVRALNGTQIMRVSNLSGGGPCTIGDFDGDGLPEVATAFGDSYRIFDPRCKSAEDGCAKPYILWEQKSQDASSASTGSSLFDFDGDGAMEAVYADECYTRVYDGKTGDGLFSAYRSSATWHEYPVIADVDNDESAEIVVGSNNAMSCATLDPIHRGLRCASDADCKSKSCIGGFCRCTSNDQCNSRTDMQGKVLDEYTCTTALAGDTEGGNVCRAKRVNSERVTGVRVMRDSLDRWTSSRNLWNQHAYSITNILDDMTIPKTSSWVQNFKQTDPKLNNYRQNVQGALGRNVAPDITGRFVGDSCSSNNGQVELGAEICNRGTKMVASLMPATFYLVGDDNSRTLLCTSYTEKNVPVGDCLHVSCKIDNVDQVMDKQIVLVANDDGNGGRTTVECNDKNNEDYTTVSSCMVY